MLCIYIFVLNTESSNCARPRDQVPEQRELVPQVVPHEPAVRAEVLHAPESAHSGSADWLAGEWGTLRLLPTFHLTLSEFAHHHLATHQKAG